MWIEYEQALAHRDELIAQAAGGRARRRPEARRSDVRWYRRVGHSGS